MENISPTTKIDASLETFATEESLQVKQTATNVTVATNQHVTHIAEPGVTDISLDSERTAENGTSSAADEASDSKMDSLTELFETRLRDSLESQDEPTTFSKEMQDKSTAFLEKHKESIARLIKQKEEIASTTNSLIDQMHHASIVIASKQVITMDRLRKSCESEDKLNELNEKMKAESDETKRQIIQEEIETTKKKSEYCKSQANDRFKSLMSGIKQYGPTVLKFNHHSNENTKAQNCLTAYMEFYVDYCTGKCEDCSNPQSLQFTASPEKENELCENATNLTQAEHDLMIRKLSDYARAEDEAREAAHRLKPETDKIIEINDELEETSDEATINELIEERKHKISKLSFKEFDWERAEGERNRARQSAYSHMKDVIGVSPEFLLLPFDQIHVAGQL
jgi:hypothetical protein